MAQNRKAIHYQIMFFVFVLLSAVWCYFMLHLVRYSMIIDRLRAGEPPQVPMLAVWREFFRGRFSRHTQPFLRLEEETSPQLEELRRRRNYMVLCFWLTILVSGLVMWFGKGGL